MNTILKKKVALAPGVGDDPKAFFAALHKAGLYAVPNPHYANDMVMNDPAKGRGAYELVIEAIEQLKQGSKQ